MKDRSQKAKVANASFFERQLERKQAASIGRFSKLLDGEHISFGWVPARRTFYVVVRGPLINLATEQTVGEFLQERTIYVERGQVNGNYARVRLL